MCPVKTPIKMLRSLLISFNASFRLFLLVGPSRFLAVTNNNKSPFYMSVDFPFCKEITIKLFPSIQANQFFMPQKIELIILIFCLKASKLYAETRFYYSHQKCFSFCNKKFEQSTEKSENKKCNLLQGT